MKNLPRSLLKYLRRITPLACDGFFVGQFDMSVEGLNCRTDCRSQPHCRRQSQHHPCRVCGHTFAYRAAVHEVNLGVIVVGGPDFSRRSAAIYACCSTLSDMLTNSAEYQPLRLPKKPRTTGASESVSCRKRFHIFQSASLIFAR
jgi:hypothetical protein